jgi:hypothetical protein
MRIKIDHAIEVKIASWYPSDLTLVSKCRCRAMAAPRIPIYPNTLPTGIVSPFAAPLYKSNVSVWSCRK